MITRPDHFLPRFVEAGADMITVHVEPESDHDVSKTSRSIPRRHLKRSNLTLIRSTFSW
jgi:pentose-5-phosphate-3-epimerase